MDTAELLEQTLALVVDRVGDPAPLVYERLFDAAPELRALFVNDPRGSVRGEMFLRAVEALLDVAHDQPYASGMLAAERTNHDGIGVTAQQFESFFEMLRQVCRQALGVDWSAEIDAAWRSALDRVAMHVAPGGLAGLAQQPVAET